jgi:YegS/Rv2252/BmrU family lipid kinase
MNVLIIYNPHAGGGRAAKLLPRVKEYCEKVGLQASFELTKYPGHAVEIAAHANMTPYDAVIASGGDGTLYEVLNGYYMNKAQLKPPMGLIPNGTGNAFTKELSLSRDDWQQAIDIIAKNKVHMIDVCRYFANDQQRYFVNIMGTGFVAEVAKLAIPFKWLGNAAYTVATLLKVIFLRSQEIDLVIDGKLSKRQSIFVEIANSRYTGTTFLMAPKARIDDGKLDIVLLNKIGRLKLLRLFNKIYDGSHVDVEEVEYIQARQVAIKEPRPKALVPDGEILGETPVSVECLQKDLAFLWP